MVKDDHCTEFPVSTNDPQIRAAVVLLNWQQSDLARAAVITTDNVGLVERGAFGSERYIAPILCVLIEMGVEFVSDRHANKMGVLFQPKHGIDWRSTAKPL